jgi:quinol monooxygenase YgiN
MNQMNFTTNINAAKLGLFVRLVSKPGKETEIKSFLKSALPLVTAEQETNLWFAIQLNGTTFAIFDAFSHESGRQAHLAGKVAEALFAKAADLFSQTPTVETFETLAIKLPSNL